MGFSQKSDVTPLTKADFLSKVFNYEKNSGKWTYEGKKPCIIDFCADWNGPCRKLSPVLAELATKYKDKIIVYKIDTDEERELAQAFGISSIPTLFFIPLDDTPQVIRGALSSVC
jgi:thioredoxin